MKETETSKQEEDAALENFLSTLHPVALSDHFFDAVENALAEEPLSQQDNSVPFPAHTPAGTRFSWRVATSAAALVFCAVGLGIWGYFAQSGVPAGADEGVAGVKASGASAAVVADAGTATFTEKSVPVVVSSRLGAEAESPRCSVRAQGNYRLVNVARTMNSVRPMEVEVLENGQLAREIHYDYVDEYSYEDNETGTALIELRPNKGVASMELEVY